MSRIIYSLSATALHCTASLYPFFFLAFSFPYFSLYTSQQWHSLRLIRHQQQQSSAVFHSVPFHSSFVSFFSKLYLMTMQKRETKQLPGRRRRKMTQQQFMFATTWSNKRFLLKGKKTRRSSSANCLIYCRCRFCSVDVPSGVAWRGESPMLICSSSFSSITNDDCEREAIDTWVVVAVG